MAQLVHLLSIAPHLLHLPGPSYTLVYIFDTYTQNHFPASAWAVACCVHGPQKNKYLLFIINNHHDRQYRQPSSAEGTGVSPASRDNGSAHTACNAARGVGAGAQAVGVFLVPYVRHVCMMRSLPDCTSSPPLRWLVPSAYSQPLFFKFAMYPGVPPKPGGLQKEDRGY